jgi:hypothetical protein
VERHEDILDVLGLGVVEPRLELLELVLIDGAGRVPAGGREAVSLAGPEVDEPGVVEVERVD